MNDHFPPADSVIKDAALRSILCRNSLSDKDLRSLFHTSMFTIWRIFTFIHENIELIDKGNETERAVIHNSINYAGMFIQDEQAYKYVTSAYPEYEYLCDMMIERIKILEREFNRLRVVKSDNKS